MLVWSERGRDTMMHAIDVRAAEGATLIFTLTERATEPWAFNNTTILGTLEN